MTFHIIILNRVLKLLGVLVKSFGYIFHSILPNKRFIIPKQSDALIKSNKNTIIPKILWQTNYSSSVSLPVYINYLVNRLMSLSYEYRYSSNEDCLSMVKEYGTQQEIEAYIKLKDGAAKADFWRVFALHKFGGVYLDIDALFVYPLSQILKSDDKELFVIPRRGIYTNYFIASKDNTDILKKTIDIIVNNITSIDTAKNENKSVYSLTGPSTVEKAIGDLKVNAKIYKIVCAQGSFTNEHFQYIDKKNGKWTHTKQEDILN